VTCVSGAQSGSTAGSDRPQQDDDDGRSVGRPDSAGTSTETSTTVSATAATTTRGAGGSYDGPGPTYVNYTANDDTVHSAAPAATGNRQSINYYSISLSFHPLPSLSLPFTPPFSFLSFCPFAPLKSV